MSQKRLRIFAGPNGSGKSILSDALKNHTDPRIKIGVFVNADLIEAKIKKEKCLNFDEFNVQTTNKDFLHFLSVAGMSPKKLNLSPEEIVLIAENQISILTEINSYIAADIAEFIRRKLMEAGESFAFETVFSHESKLELIRKANKLGYKVYLYFITTEDPEININRVSLRVKKGGHDVPSELIKSRYERTMKLLYPAIKECNRSFLFDNSGKFYELVATVEPGGRVNVTDYDNKLPIWFDRYVYAISKKKNKKN